MQVSWLGATIKPLVLIHDSHDHGKANMISNSWKNSYPRCFQHPLKSLRPHTHWRHYISYWARPDHASPLFLWFSFFMRLKHPRYLHDMLNSNICTLYSSHIPIQRDLYVKDPKAMKICPLSFARTGCLHMPPKEDLHIITILVLSC